MRWGTTNWHHLQAKVRTSCYFITLFDWNHHQIVQVQKFRAADEALLCPEDCCCAGDSSYQVVMLVWCQRLWHYQRPRKSPALECCTNKPWIWMLVPDCCYCQSALNFTVIWNFEFEPLFTCCFMQQYHNLKRLTDHCVSMTVMPAIFKVMISA